MFENIHNAEDRDITPCENSRYGTGPEKVDRILDALRNTEKTSPDYFLSMFEQRLKDGFGSRYDIDNAQKLQETLFNRDILADAFEYIPREGAYENCIYITVPHPDLVAKLGIVPLRDLIEKDKNDETREIRWADPKNLGEFAATCLVRDFNKLPDAFYTTIVIETPDKDDPSKDVVATFFPGNTFDMSKMIVEGSKPENTTVKGAIKKGIYYAKTCDEQEWEQIK